MLIIHSWFKMHNTVVDQFNTVGGSTISRPKLINKSSNSGIWKKKKQKKEKPRKWKANKKGKQIKLLLNWY